MINWDDIDFGSKTTGQVKVKCPACIEQRSNKRDKSLYVSLDKGVGKCYYCNGITIRDYKEVQKPRKYELPNQEWHNYTSISDKLVKYFSERGISQSTLIECKITEEEYYQPQAGKKVNNIVFNYFEGDTLVNKKYRSAKKEFTQTAKTKNVFYGLNDVIGSKEVYIVEGEIDKLSLWEVGIKNCISVPNGANDNDDVWINSEQYISDCERFYIATDNDKKGNEVADKIAQRLGRWRCERVQFKNKDANDDLKESRFTLEESIKNTKKYPVSGSFNSEDLRDDILSLYDTGIPVTISPKGSWFEGLNSVFSVMRGHLITGTGIPSHGKSSFTDWYVLNLINDYDMKASWFSPEHHPMSLHKSKFISMFWGKPFFNESGTDERVTKSEIDKYIGWSKEKIYLTSPEKGESPTWDWVFDKFKEQMYSFGIDVFVIDAFNKVQMPNGNKKDQIDNVLTRLTNFAQINNVLIFLIAHPTKMRKNETGNYEVPTLYDVSGSADFRNQTHDGYCIYRIFDTDQQEGQTMFINLKTKFDFQGEIGKDYRFKYHKHSKRYYPMVKGYDKSPLVEFEEPQLNYNNDIFKQKIDTNIWTDENMPF